MLHVSFTEQSLRVIDAQALICLLMEALIFCQDKKCSHNLVAMILIVWPSENDDGGHTSINHDALIEPISMWIVMFVGSRVKRPHVNFLIA